MMIFKKLLTNKKLHLSIAETLLQYLEFSLEIDPLSSEEYFFLLTQLLTQEEDGSASGEPQPIKLSLENALAHGPPKIVVETVEKKKKEPPVKQLEITEDTKRHFTQVFSKIDGELVKLFQLEQGKKALGQDGFMPQLSAG